MLVAISVLANATIMCVIMVASRRLVDEKSAWAFSRRRVIDILGMRDTLVG